MLYLVSSICPALTLIALGGKAKKNWDPKRIQRLSEFRENLRSRMGSKYEGAWSLEVGTNSKGEAQGEKKKRKGKKERAKLRAMESDNAGEANDGSQPEDTTKSQTQKRDLDVGSHPPAEAEADGEDGARRKRRRRHKKWSGGDEKMDAVAVS